MFFYYKQHILQCKVLLNKNHGFLKKYIYLKIFRKINIERIKDKFKNKLHLVVHKRTFQFLKLNSKLKIGFYKKVTKIYHIYQFYWLRGHAN